MKNHEERVVEWYILVKKLKWFPGGPGATNMVNDPLQDYKESNCEKS